MEPVPYNREQSKLFEHFSKSRGDNEKICVEWSDLHYSILTKDAAKSSFFSPIYKNKTILRSMHGKVTSGELLAIMGPTGKFLTRFLCTDTMQLSLTHISSYCKGCGKTSLLNVLAARVSNAGSKAAELTGKILVNGKPRDDETFRRISAYVLQVETMKQTLLLLCVPNFTLIKSFPG